VNALSLLISLKLTVTLLLLVGPFLLFSTEKLGRLLSISANSPTFFRLYGMAMLALATAYAGGLWFAWQGTFPWVIVLMGVVSNCGAAVVLLRGPDTRKLRPQALLFGAIGIGFVLSALFSDKAIAPLV